MGGSLGVLGFLAMSQGVIGFSIIPCSRDFPLTNKTPSAESVLVKFYGLLLLEFRVKAVAEQIFLIDLLYRIFTSNVIVTVVFPILNA